MMEQGIPMEVIVELKNFGCKAGCRYLLKHINWQIKRGEHWVVFGSNGCGKTTLLSAIAGYRAYSEGEMKIFGQPYREDNVLELRKRIGFVSSSFFDKILSKESVLDIVLAGKFGTIGLDGDICNQDVKWAKALLGEWHMGGKLNRTFDLLSKGERQNVLIARALMSKPELLILDEPGTGLDVFSREYLLTTVKALAEKTNLTIIYVTHYVEEILPAFGQCLLLKEGRPYLMGPSADVLTAEHISQLLEYPVELENCSGRLQLRLAVQSKTQEIM